MWNVSLRRQASVVVVLNTFLLLLLGGCSPALLGLDLQQLSDSPEVETPAPVLPGPVATIARASGQSVKTGVVPITFDIEFDVPVTGFDANDVTFNGDSSSLVYNVTGSGTSYVLEVTSVDRSRSLIPTVKVSSVTDADGVPNAASYTADTSERVDHRPLKFKQVVNGTSSGCGLTGEGLAYCWGSDTAGQLGNGNGAGLTANQVSPSLVDMGPVGNGRFVQLATAYNSACGLTAEGLAYCWGDDTFGQLGNGATTGNQVSPSAVDMTPVAGGRFAQLFGTSGLHYCAITAEGVAYCWGYDGNSQLGNGATAGNQVSPSPVNTSGMTGDTSFTYIVTGSSHSCGLSGDGVAYCWGAENDGQLGNGGSLAGTQTSPFPVDMTPVGSGKFVQIAAGGNHACGLTADGLAYCWGLDTNGQLGNGAALTAKQASPSPVDISALPADDRVFVQLSAGGGVTCALSAKGVAYCWGYDGFGAAGNGTVLTADQVSPSPVDVSSLSASDQVFAQLGGASTWTSCALNAQGAVYCWGRDDLGQLGNGSVLTADLFSPSPVDVSALTSELSFEQVVSGEGHTCGLTSEGFAYCWGLDTDGQLGNGTVVTAEQFTPSPVDMSPLGGERFVQLATGWEHTCGLSSQGLAYCWGSDEDGQLGNGAGLTTNQEVPSLVDTASLLAADQAFVQLVAGRRQTCGLTAQGLAYCWGSDANGQLGNGGAITGSQESPSPVDLAPLGTGKLVQLVAGGYHTCGLTAQGAAYCWGLDDVGELGNGAGITGTQVSPSPVDISTLTVGDQMFVRLAVGEFHTCGVTAKGVAYCWGSDLHGQAGNGGGITGNQVSPSPVDILPLAAGESFVQIAAGSYHTCGQTDLGSMYCWGLDHVGQLGNSDGITGNQVSPSAVDVSLLSGGAVFTQISTGNFQTCALNSQGAPHCWGANFSGQLGNDAESGTEESPSVVDLSDL